MTDGGFTLHVHITGLCILAHQPNYVHVVMPPTPPDDPDVPVHQPMLAFDPVHSKEDRTGVGLDGLYVVIRGDDRDVLCPSLPKSLIDLTDTFNKKLPGGMVIPASSGASALVRLETGQAAANMPGNLFCVEAGKSARHLSWLVTWMTKFATSSLKLEFRAMTDGSVVDCVELYPNEHGKIDIMVFNMPLGRMSDSPPNRFDQVHHFMAYYRFLKIDEPAPTFYDTVPTSLTASQFRGLLIPNAVRNNAFTCIPTSSQID